MTSMRRDGTRSAVLALSLALGGEWTVHAQGLSSGSGVGTGAGGAMTGARTDSGSGAMSGAFTGAGGAMSGRGYGGGGGLGRATALPLGRRQGTVPFGPGVDVSFPNDPYLLPFLVPDEVDNPPEGRAPSKITVELLRNARQITDPSERSLALRQIANGAIASNQTVVAHHALEESIAAASQVNIPLVRDQRLIGLVMSLNNLSTALLRKGHDEQNLTATTEESRAAGLAPLPNRPESAVMIRMARLEWRRAQYLASIISNPTYRNEMLYRVAEDEATGSSYIVTEYTRTFEFGSLGLPLGNRTAPDQAPGRAIPPGGPASNPRPAQAGGAEERPDYNKLADEVLVDAWEVARGIDRLLWKNRAMVRIALAASDSGQFARAVELSRTIENAESRAEALLLLADAMCRPAHNQLEAATPAYQGAAEAVASIPQAGLRGVMTGFLIDGLIASGRFEDARACTALYPEEAEKFVAMGAIAEAQGRRGLADAARLWIDAEAPEAYRSALYRRVSTGALAAIENQRARELPSGGEPGPVR